MRHRDSYISRYRFFDEPVILFEFRRQSQETNYLQIEPRQRFIPASTSYEAAELRSSAAGVQEWSFQVRSKEFSSGSEQAHGFGDRL